MNFPKKRMRRLRKNKNLRNLVQKIRLNKNDVLYPIFVKEGIEEKKEIRSMKNQYHYPINGLDSIVSLCEDNDLQGVLLFGVPSNKDQKGSSAFDDNGIVQRAVRRIKEISNLAVFTDICLCQYTSHGHCGILDQNGVNNDKTLEILNKIAVSHAEAGADFVAPSGMMDGQVKSIRGALDEKGYQNTGIMAYSAKFSSNFYGPFRDAAECSPGGEKTNLSNRDTYQMDFKTEASQQPMEEIRLDLEQGADITMVKPALPYLDVIKEAKDRFNAPVAAYNVSGEYAMLKSAINEGLLSEKVIEESLISIKRAGADIIITYFAKELIKDGRI